MQQSLSFFAAFPDCKLVRQAQLGNKEAFGELICRHCDDRLLTKVSRLTRNKEIAEDICQLASLQAWLKIRQLRDPCKFWCWFYRIALNLARRPPRDIVESGDNPLPDDAENCYISSEFSPEGTVIVREALKRALRKLPKQLRQIVVWHLLGESREQIAEKTGLESERVRQEIWRGMKQLREELRKALPEYFLEKPDNLEDDESGDQERKEHE